MEEKSGVKFDQARVALARQWIGEVIQGEEVQKEITIRVAVPTTEGLVVSDETPVLTETVPIPKSAEEARRIVRKFEQGADGIRGDSEVSDTVAQHMLHDSTNLADEKWLGTEEEELNA
jgi:phospholipase D1/2